MRTLSIYTIAAINCALTLLHCSAFTTTPLTRTTFLTTPTTTTSRQMFGGAGSAPALDDEESEAREKEIEAAAKAMGFSTNEYKLVLRMQQSLASAVNDLRVSGGSEEKGVTVAMDGNSPPGFVEVVISEDAKGTGKASLEKELVAALKEATDKAKVGQQEAVQKMNAEIAEEMKSSGMV